MVVIAGFCAGGWDSDNWLYPASMAAWAVAFPGAACPIFLKSKPLAKLKLDLHDIYIHFRF
jgi:hypothetical protein